MSTTKLGHESTAYNRLPGTRARWIAGVGLAALLLLGLVAGVTALRGAEGRAENPDHGAAERPGNRPAAGAGKAAPAAQEKRAEHEDHGEEAGHEEHADHDEQPDERERATHAGEAHPEDEGGEGHEGHGHGDEERSDEGVALSADEKRNAGIVIATAGPGDLATEISLAGEVSLNRDRVVHVVPQVPGVAVDIRATEGETVEAGQVLAILDSSALGEAKLDYLTKINEILSCNLLVPRAKAVHDSTLKLLDFLGGNPLLEDLQGFDAGEAGENLTALMGAYAELAEARQAFEREQGLHRKEITSGQEYFAAKTAYEKAAAGYRAARDTVAFQVRRELSEAEGTLRAAKFAARSAEQRLRIMGVSDADIHQLDGLVLPEKECTDPNCKGCSPGMGAKEQEHFFGNGFAKYEIRAPLAGRVVEKHLSRGEKVSDDADIFTIADTATVWAELTVHLKDLPALQVGAEVTIRAQHSSATTRGKITMLSPTVDPETRTATARVTLDNGDGEWRPGVFVAGLVRISAESLSVVIPKQAVQTVDGKQVVFVPRGDRFAPVAVQTGRVDRERAEVVSGLEAGTPFVAEGAFEIKAKLVTSALGSHAGHGH